MASYFMSSVVFSRAEGECKYSVESLGTALASTTLQAKPAWARVRLNKFLNVYN